MDRGSSTTYFNFVFKGRTCNKYNCPEEKFGTILINTPSPKNSTSDGSMIKQAVGANVDVDEVVGEVGFVGLTPCFESDVKIPAEKQ